jgi:hypothetical protein
MFLLFFILYCFFFLTVGAVVFLVCVTTPVLRRFALSAALWCAVWGPCAIAWLLMAGMVAFAGDYGMRHIDMQRLHFPEWRRGFGLGLFWLAVLTTAMVASAVAWIHRMTFQLFRVYAAVVSAGLGSVFGWVTGFAIAVNQLRFGWALWVVAMGVLVGGFGYLGFRRARWLRGEPPKRFAWVTREEFERTG